jgi:hypothetical protein
MTRATGEDARRYLLGRLSDDEAAALERAYLADPVRVDEVAAAESELVDAYVAGTLEAADREAFDAHYLQSPVHRDRVETARLLRAAAANARFRARSLPVVWLGAAAAAILLAAIFWPRPRLGEPSRVADRPVPAGTATVAPPAPAPTPTATAPRWLPTRTVAFALGAIRVRSEEAAAPELRVPRNAGAIAFELARTAERPAGALAFVVRTVEGRAVASGRVQRGSDGALGVAHVRADRLAPDDYLLAVSTVAAEEPVAQYFFRVVP